jgi:ubiquinone/menaquinone biosynthesis C-methylase UbiE
MINFFKHRTAKQTRSFYSGLVEGSKKRGVWGKENRFDPDVIGDKPSVQRHFVSVITPFLASQDRCLDLGCGPGGFIALIAPLCREVVGADVVPEFVAQCRSTLVRKELFNASAVLLEKEELPFADGEFDKVVMVDTVHHLEFHEKTMSEVYRVLKPGGLLLIFEPNKANPLLALLCALDPNEHGLLRLGTFSSYARLLEHRFQIIRQAHNGMLVGPQSHLSVAIADYVSGTGHEAFAWLSPKLFIVASKSSRE